MKNWSKGLRKGFVRFGTALIAVSALVIGTALPANADGIGYGGGSGTKAGGSTWVAAAGWSDFVAKSHQSEGWLATKINSLDTDVSNLLYECQMSKAIWFVQFKPDQKFWGLDPKFYVDGYTADYPASHLVSPNASLNVVTIMAKWNVQSYGRHTTDTVIICSRNIGGHNSEFAVQTQSFTGSKTNHASNTFFGPANLNTQVTRQIIQGTATDPIGVANLHDQPKASATTTFGTYLQSLTTQDLSSQAAYDAINNTLKGAPYNAVLTASPPLSSSFTYRITPTVDRPDITLDDANIAGLAEGGVLNVSQFDDYGYVTTTQDDTFSYNFTWKCIGQASLTWPGITKEGTLVGGGTIQIVANEAAAQTAVTNNYAGWSCFVSSGVKPTDFNEASVANRWTLDNQTWKVLKAPTTQLSSAFYQIMTVHCNLDEYNALIADLGVAGTDYFVMSQSIGIDNSVTAMIRTKVYTAGSITPPDDPIGKRQAADQLYSNWQAAQAVADAQALLASQAETSATQTEATAENMKPDLNPNFTVANNDLTNKSAAYNTASNNLKTALQDLKSKLSAFNAAVLPYANKCLPTAPVAARNTYIAAYGSSTSGYVKALNDYLAALTFDPGAAPDNIASYDFDAIDAAKNAYITAEASLKTALNSISTNCFSGVATVALPAPPNPPVTNIVEDVAGNLYWGAANGTLVKYDGSTFTTFASSTLYASQQTRLVMHPNGYIYVLSQLSSLIYKVSPTGVLSPVGTPSARFMDGPGVVASTNNIVYTSNADKRFGIIVVPSDPNLGHSLTSTDLPIPVAAGRAKEAVIINDLIYFVTTGGYFYSLNSATLGLTQLGTGYSNITQMGKTLDNKILLGTDLGDIDIYDPASGSRTAAPYSFGPSAFLESTGFYSAKDGTLYSYWTDSGLSGFMKTVPATSGPEKDAYNVALSALQTSQNTFNTRETTVKTAQNNAIVATCNFDTIQMFGASAVYPACDSTHMTPPGTMTQPSTVAQNCSPVQSYGCFVNLSTVRRNDAIEKRAEADRLQTAADVIYQDYLFADQLADSAETSTWGYTPADPALRGVHRDLGDQANPSTPRAKTGNIGFYDKECTIACTSDPATFDNSDLVQAYQDAQAAEAAALSALNAAQTAATTALGQVGTTQTALNTARNSYETARASAVAAANSLKTFITTVPTASGGNGYANLTSTGSTSSAAALSLTQALTVYANYYQPNVVNPNPKTSESTNATTQATAFIDGSADSVNGDTSALVSNTNTNMPVGGTASNCGSNAKISICVYMYETGAVNLATNQSQVSLRVVLTNNSSSYHCDPMPGKSGSGIMTFSGSIDGLAQASRANCVGTDSNVVVYTDSVHWVTHNAARGGTVTQSAGFSYGSVGTSGQFGAVSTSATLTLRTLAPASISVMDGMGANGVAATNVFLNTNATFATRYSNYSTAQTNYTNAVANNAARIAAVAAAQTVYDNAVLATQAAKNALDSSPQTATGDTVVGVGGSYDGNRAEFNASTVGTLLHRDELGGVVIDKNATNPVNSNYLEVYRDNNTHQLTVNVTYPDTDTKTTSTGEKSLIYRGQAPISTTVVLWNMSTPNTTPAASQFLISAADKNGVNRAPMLSGTTDPATVAQRNFSGPGRLDTYNGLLASQVAGFYNDFNVSGTWSSTKTRPVVLNVKWEYQPVNIVTVPTFVGFTSTLAVEPNTHPVNVEQAIDVRCYANFGELDGIQPTDTTVFPTRNAAGALISNTGQYKDAVANYTGTGTTNALDTQLLEGPRNEDNAAVRAANPGQNFNYGFPHDTSQAEINSGVADPDMLRAASDGDLVYTTGTNLVLKFIRSVAN